MLSSLQHQVSGWQAELVGHALGELRAAGADMDTSVAELRTPLDGRSVERAAETTGAALTVGPGRGGRGTTVRLTVPTGPEEGSRTP